MKGDVMKILFQVYAEVTDLETWLKQIFGPESRIAKTLIQEGDSDGYQDLLKNCLVARYHDVPPVQQITSAEQVSYQNELLLRIIENPICQDDLFNVPMMDEIEVSGEIVKYKHSVEILGVYTLNYKTNDSLAAKRSNELTNEDILQLQNYLTQKNLKFSMMVMWINRLLSSNYDEKHLSSTLKKLVIENQIKRKNKTQRPQELQQFFTSPFHERVTLSSQVKSPDESNDSATIEHPPASKIKALEESVKKYQNKLSDMRTAFRLLTAKYETVSKQKTSLLNQNVHVKNVIARLRMEVSKQSIDRQKKLTKSKLYKIIYMLKQMNKKRLSENNELKKQVNSLKEIQVKLKAEKVSLQKTTSLLKRKCKKLRNEKTSRDEEAIQQILEKNKKEVRATRDSWCNRFNDNVRMTIIGLQVAGISASKCSQVIDIVDCNLFEEKLDDLPSISTSANISDESHFITKLHAAKMILQSPSVTLHTDGTSRQKNCRGTIIRCSRIKNRTKSPVNIMAHGFQMLSTNNNVMRTQHYNIECFYPSYIYSRLRSPHFEKLLSRIGDEAMELLMSKRSLFIPFPHTSYLQLTGKPLYDLIKVGQQIYSKPQTKSQVLFKKRKFPFHDEEISAPTKFLKNSSSQRGSIVHLSSKTEARCFSRPIISSDTSLPSSNRSLISPKVTKLIETFSADFSPAQSDYSNSPTSVSKISSGNILQIKTSGFCKNPLGRTSDKPNPNVPLQKYKKCLSQESLCLNSETVPDSCRRVLSLNDTSKNRSQEMGILSNQTSSPRKRHWNDDQFKSNKNENELTINVNKNGDSKYLKLDILPKDSKKKKTRRGKRKPKKVLFSCSLMKRIFNPYNYYDVIPHSYILYVKDLHQRLDKHQLLCSAEDVSEVSEMIFIDMFAKSKPNLKSEVSLDCDPVCTIETNTVPSCQPTPGTFPMTEGQSEFSTTDTSCPKCKVKSFLKAHVKPLLERLIQNHRCCHHMSLLNYHCPFVVTKAEPQRRRTSKNKTTADSSKKNRNTSATKSSIKVIKKFTTRRRKASVKMLLDDFIPHKQVYRFVRACLLRLIPTQLLGSDHNMAILLKNVKKYIFLGKFEKLCLGQIMNGIKVSSCMWLRKIPSLSWRCHLLSRCLAWIFFNIVIVIIRGFFYVTETRQYRNRLFYYRKPVWLHLRQLAVRDFLAKGLLKPIRHAEVFHKIVKGDCLGVSCLRFLPKGKSFRPIINMNCTNLKSIPKKPPINRQLSGLFYAFNVIKDKYPELMGYSVFGIDDIYKKWKKFVMKRQQTNSKRPLYFVKMDIKECFNFIDQKRLKNIVYEILDMVGNDFLIRRYAKVFCVRGKLKRSFSCDAMFESDHIPNFRIYIENIKDKKNLSNSIVIDKILYDHLRFNEIMKKLLSHIGNNVVKLDSHYYLQTMGISQGSILSTLLCNIYYGDMEKNLLQLDSDSLMMRMVDDFLLVTPHKSTAFRFLNKMLNGIPLYNCRIQPEKTVVNFDYHHKTFGNLPRILETEMLPWCGLLIDTKSLNVKRDYNCYAGLGVSDTITINLMPQMATTLSYRILKCINPKCMTIFLDKKINSDATIAWNVFNCFYLAAHRFHALVQRLSNKQQTVDSARFFFRAIHFIADQFFKHVKTKMKQINSVQTYPFSKLENKWLCFMAFFIQLSSHQSQHGKLHSMLKKAGFRGKSMLSTKRKKMLLQTVVNGPLQNVLSLMK